MPEEIERVKGIQRDILQRYSTMVSPGGSMVYATCSILPSEGEQQIEWFMSSNSDKWKITGQKRCWPEDGTDGFYMALLERLP
jgi:16S rRNA (cytosine967-C5)-methyltransferase